MCLTLCKLPQRSTRRGNNAVKAHMDVHSADNRKAEGSNPSHSTNFNKVVDIEM
ncbi:unknown [Salmonella phage FelixO1]|uniref:Uncharacterized protein n=1 Tax=Salmonella phage Felix O1 (isolate Felix O1-VT1) TaxID=1283336 RepID=Q6KGL4_BPFO1|nr:unknown [Salmonella phage FelixO1]